jgi:hypothetical protein
LARRFPCFDLAGANRLSIDKLRPGCKQHMLQHPNDSPPLDVPIAVDLDGTLIRADCLHEGFVACVSTAPVAALQLITALRHGKAAFKTAVASRVDFDPSLLPYNKELVDYLRNEKRRGRRIGLFTAADSSVAEKVAAYLGIFDVVRASNGKSNLEAQTKASAIRRPLAIGSPCRQ